MSHLDPAADEGSQTTDFGYQQVPVRQKQARVAEVFDSVAGRYDLMNDLMSFGIHRLWKRLTVEMSALRPGDWALDVAAGTGDLTALMRRKVGRHGRVIMSDINSAMLQRGRDRLLDRGVAGNVDWLISDAESLPFADDSFAVVTIGFGLRNVTDKARALAEMARILKPGGRLLVLEFSKPTHRLLAQCYDRYSFSVLPRLGRLVTQDSESYRYLAESIRMHPDQERLRAMMAEAGLAECRYHNLTGGIVALHRAIKP